MEDMEEEDLEMDFKSINVTGDSGMDYHIRDAQGNFLWEDKSTPAQKLQTMKIIYNGLSDTLKRVDVIIGNSYKNQKGFDRYKNLKGGLRYKNQKVYDQIKFGPYPGEESRLYLDVKKLVEIGGYIRKVDLDVVSEAFDILAPFYLLKYFDINNVREGFYKSGLVKSRGEGGPLIINLKYFVRDVYFVRYEDELYEYYGYYEEELYKFSLEARQYQTRYMRDDFYTIYYDILTQGKVPYVLDDDYEEEYMNYYP